MGALDTVLERKLATLAPPLAVVLPGGRRFGPAEADVTIRLKELGPLAHIAAGQVGHVAQDYVEGRLDVEGKLRDVMEVAAKMIGVDPTHRSDAKPLT